MSMNATLINLLEQNRAENVGVRKSGKKIPPGTIVNEDSRQEDMQPSSSPEILKRNT